ncbi:hypothetical protein [Nodosilinea nodulosa]|uniref:hypothetical protein n=1 Tax=Nodosilinea nodulosa TaxID=416001 RepID=UPI0003658886|nr:hypothetical protein [Nodosilinea nodulosa]
MSPESAGAIASTQLSRISLGVGADPEAIFRLVNAILPLPIGVGRIALAQS